MLAETLLEWMDFFKELFDIEQFKFHRCLKPDNAVGDPILVIFSDGSKLAYGTCAYVRWRTEHGEFESRLVIAKNRTNSTRKLSIRHICCHKGSIIQNKNEPSDWWWVASEFNAADLATRITFPNDLVKNSIWKNGPEFLNDPIDQWPLRQDCNLGNEEVPDTKGIVMSSEIKKITDTMSRLDFEDVILENISSYSKLLRVTFILMRIATTKSLKSTSMGITAESLNAAEVACIRYLQRNISDDWTKTFRRLSPEKNEAGVVVVGKKLADWLKATWNRTDLMLLPMGPIKGIMCGYI
ncbi:unnamed protein product [Mytilus coruscus]|uniref:Uncharacterized protein n=1 Tax=Mytilus coruscus TaxID=42192 RepID=A0A6J8B2T7_MYTCO|nr:unnamed protein product [Mytilus coruscus]